MVSLGCFVVIFVVTTTKLAERRAHLADVEVLLPIHPVIIVSNVLCVLDGWAACTASAAVVNLRCKGLPKYPSDLLVAARTELFTPQTKTVAKARLVLLHRTLMVDISGPVYAPAPLTRFLSIPGQFLERQGDYHTPCHVGAHQPRVIAAARRHHRSRARRGQSSISIPLPAAVSESVFTQEAPAVAVAVAPVPIAISTPAPIRAKGTTTLILASLARDDNDADAELTFQFDAIRRLDALSSAAVPPVDAPAPAQPQVLVDSRLRQLRRAPHVKKAAGTSSSGGRPKRTSVIRGKVDYGDKENTRTEIQPSTPRRVL
ncbi:hypothetical protein B0H19DRAFT_1248938 [Mycena capillaripes]|nr:hypothetical protein B0H19DRAFT_1248938 [Mycena capillaripes]